MQAPVIVEVIVSGLLMGGVYALVALGLNLIFGVMQVVNFAHGSLMMLSMYLVYWLFVYLELDPYLALVLCLPAMFFLGFLIQKVLINPLIKAPEMNQLLLTAGLMLFIDNLAVFLWGTDFRSVLVSYGNVTVNILGVKILGTKLIAFLGAILMTMAMFLILKNTLVGKAIRASSQNLEGATSVGVNAKYIYALTFGLGTASVAAAGLLLTPFYYISPHVGGYFLMIAFIVTVLGGLGNFFGCLVGGLIIGVVESLGGYLMMGSLGQVMVFVIFVMILLFKPAGLFGAKVHS